MALDTAPDWQSRLKPTDRRTPYEAVAKMMDFISDDPFETIAVRNGFSGVLEDGRLYSECPRCWRKEYVAKWNARCGVCQADWEQDQKEKAKTGGVWL